MNELTKGDLIIYEDENDKIEIEAFLYDETIWLPLNKIAELFLSRYEDADRYCVRGVTQYQLKGLLALEELGHPQFAIFYIPMLLETDDVLISVRLTAKEVAENYLNKYS